MTTAEPPAVAIEGVSHCYGRRQALNDVTFSIAASTFAVLLGLNGAGKSTLFSLITRLYAIQRGRIRIFGRDVAHESSEALRMVGVVFQQRRCMGPFHACWTPPVLKISAQLSLA